MFKRFISIGLISLLATIEPLPAAAQLTAVPINELTDSMRVQPKPALILISTSWCTYCRMQQVQLKKSSTVFQAAPSQIYFSELDAETKEDLMFNHKTYRFVPSGASTGSHELAFTLGNINNRLAFPTWVLVDSNFEIIFKFPGILKAAELAELLETVRDAAQKNLE
ncbi:thioredoxin family protein [Parapedobacter soli]|uniref:thioredoxin family protein n=1 Tax=Parapedobacter soli TaxID=416955 RepID=UPI0021C5F9D5|nr:thioredoxin fold domain-containing protein [Parapedobacter soli]